MNFLKSLLDTKVNSDKEALELINQHYKIPGANQSPDNIHEQSIIDEEEFTRLDDKIKEGIATEEEE